MKIAIITSGGAGMFCGSCMQDNTLARTLQLAGHDAVLVPTYTPIRVDEENVSGERVFLGGINVYLDSTIPGWQSLPGWMTGWLNQSSVIRWLSRVETSTDAAKLGALTLDILKGSQGPQHREIHELTNYLCDDLRPDVIIFSNALLSGVLSELRGRFTGSILCLLQGDDIFLEGLSKRWKQPVMDQLIENCSDFDGFLTHSRYYQDFMTEYLRVSADRFRRIPLTIDDRESVARIANPSEEIRSDYRIGYFARICPEKGVHNLLHAAATVLPEFPDASITIAGYLSGQHRQWFEQLLADTRRIVGDRIEWLGSPDSRDEKFRIVRTFDVLCVPTEYREPKGIYVLEAGLQGVPSLVPNHGAFPELIEQLGHGMLYDAANAQGLPDSLCRLISSGPAFTDDLQQQVSQRFGMQATAAKVMAGISELSHVV